MGGYGAVRIGMKRPDVFSSLYIMSACCLTANRLPRPEALAAAEAIRTRQQAEEASRGLGYGPSVSLAWAAAWSPNPRNPPLYLDLPVRNGKVRPDIIAKWVANAPLEMIEAHAEGLKRYYAIAIDIGTNDTEIVVESGTNDTLLAANFYGNLNLPWLSDPLADQYREALVQWYGPERGKKVKHAEAFEVCEYGRRVTEEQIKKLFPFYE